MRPYRIAAVALAAAAFVPAARADDVTEQIESGKALYEKGDYAKALSELQFAIGDIQKKVAEKYVQAMPPAPSGWEADDAEAQSGAMLGGGQMVSRRYRESGGEGELTLQITIDNPMVQAMSAMFANPALIAADPHAKRIRVGGDNAVLKWDAANKSGDVSMVLGGRMMVNLEGRNLKSDAALQDFIKGWDMKPLKLAAGLQ